MEKPKWEKTANRFVAFFDIMGFKDMVMRNDHSYVLDKITFIKNAAHSAFDEFTAGTIKSYQFSDSIFSFTMSDSINDVTGLFIASIGFMHRSIALGIPIKGAISYGKITIDIENSIFVGQPIIDAYLLHEELEMYGVLFDFNAEKKIIELKHAGVFGEAFDLDSTMISYKAPTKNGKINHYCLNWLWLNLPSIMPKPKDGKIDFRERTYSPTPYEKEKIKKFYLSVSGKSRRYVDNTLDFYEYLISSLKKNPVREDYPEK